MGSKAQGLHGEVVRCIVAGVSRDCVPHSTTTVGYSTATSQNLEMFKPKRHVGTNFLQKNDSRRFLRKRERGYWFNLSFRRKRVEDSTRRESRSFCFDCKNGCPLEFIPCLTRDGHENFFLKLSYYQKEVSLAISPTLNFFL